MTLSLRRWPIFKCALSLIYTIDDNLNDKPLIRHKKIFHKTSDELARDFLQNIFQFIDKLCMCLKAWFTVFDKAIIPGFDGSITHV